MADRTDSMLALATCSATARDFLIAVAENPKTRRAAERFAASLLLATSAAEVEQSGKVVNIGKGAEHG